MTTQIEKAMDIAKNTAAKKEAAKENLSKKPDESKTPAAGESPADKKALETPKEKSALEKAEEGAEKDKAILEKPEENLTADEKARKLELKAAKPSAGKVIDDLKKELKTLKAEVDKSAEDKKRIAAMEEEIKTLRVAVTKPAETKKEADLVAAKEKERIDKYLSSDKSLPKEERREMSKEDLEEWFIQDPTAAQEWITQKVLRRDRERQADMAEITNKSKASDIIAAQDASQKKVILKHPDLDITGRLNDLRKEGKTPEEARVIVQKENPEGFKKAKLIAEIIKEDEDRYFLTPNGPELLMEEMERRLLKKAPDKETEDERDRRIADEAAEAERQRQDNIDKPLHSSSNGKPKVEETEAYKKGLSLYLRANRGKKTKADYDKILERRRGMPGAETG